MRGRYAPSPTGFLHLGNARTALVAWLETRRQNGSFIMRVEDIDRQRTVPEAVLGNLHEVRWLGLTWDEGMDVGGAYAPYLQSERDEYYEAALDTLRREGHIFECYLSRKDLREIASAPHGQAAAYGGLERTLNLDCAPARRAEGKSPSLRFRVEEETLRFSDHLAGEQTLRVHETVGDFVVRRADGLWAYQLAVVVDDIAMKISQVVRGDDLISSTGAQLLLYRALGATPPEYMHVPLLLDTDGERLAKRKGSMTLNALRERGVKPERIVGLLAYTLGLLETPQEVGLEALLPHYHPDRLHRHPGQLTEEQLNWLQAGMSF